MNKEKPENKEYICFDCKKEYHLSPEHNNQLFCPGCVRKSKKDIERNGLEFKLD